MDVTLEALGISKEKIEQAVVETLCETFVEENSLLSESKLSQKVAEAIQEAIDAKVDEVAITCIIPKVSEMVEACVLQETNKWGEKIEKPLTFVEYMVSRAEHYITEEVNYEGKSRREDSGCGWRKNQARLSFLIEKHLHYEIERAMKEALLTVNSSIAEGLEKTVKIKIQEVLSSLKVAVKTC